MIHYDTVIYFTVLQPACSICCVLYSIEVKVGICTVMHSAKGQIYSISMHVCGHVCHKHTQLHILLKNKFITFAHTNTSTK